MFISLYNQIIYQPLLNFLVFLYNYIPGQDMGVVIILLTIIIRLLSAPLMQKQLKSQKAMNDLQPALNEIKEKYKNDKEAQAKATMDLYKEHKINPLSSCLPLLVQLPVLIALYQVFDKALKGDLAGLYSFVNKPEFINPQFLNIIDLSKPSIYLGVIAGFLQYWQSRQMYASSQPSTDATAKAMSIQTMYVLPVVSVFIALNLPAGLPLYWIITTLFAIGQQYYIMKKPKNT